MEQNTRNPEARTTIDTMLELIRSKQRIDLNSVASSLGIAPSVVEGWAKVLESGNLIKISYEMGKMFLSPMSLSKEDLQTLESQTTQKTYILSEELESEILNTKKLEDALRDISSNIASFGQKLQKESPEAHKKVEELSKLYSEMRSYQSHIDSIKKGIGSDYDDMEKRFNELLKKLADVTEQEQKAKSVAPETIMNSLDAAKSTLKEIETVKINVSHSLEATRKDLENQIKQENIRLNEIIKQSHEQLEGAYKELEKESGTYKSNIKEIKDLQLHEEQLSKKLNQEHSEFNANYSKLEQSLKEAIAKFTPKYEEALSKLNDTMANAGSVGEIIKNIGDITYQVSDLEPKISKYRQELQRIKDQADAIAAARNLSAVQKDEKINDLKNKSDSTLKEMRDKSSAIEGTINKIKGSKGKVDNADKPESNQ